MQRKTQPIIQRPLSTDGGIIRPDETHPAPEVPGDTEWQRLDNAVRTMFKVPEAAILRERERMKPEREKKKRAKKQK